eukprot:CAMPEP_0176346194 /NCGR_PEP_ID=MMETSP0126-20121128/6048_1 /TAXON_ID=141414 ORGANISM="Strombidinopsis acuminatum, Strain SPMC142" /NCGR_SAMPLE_ID=MMETSP0126 /ASSEMBLY_ACC=CAM_ASM_000229 /LENGTH=69 /DNA_ID=CAMNT_0017693595 /DNA_START=231 /DNA_END=440 /DNA_ORIENTATION=-
MIAQIGDKKVHEHITEGREKMVSVSAAPAGAVATTAAAATEEKAEEEKKEEEEEEVDADMGGLFGDEDY